MNQPIYINGTGMISPQKTAETKEFLSEITACEGDFLKCVDPDYKAYIDPIAGRRMSRLIKMGITAAKICLDDADCRMPDAIITGTGLGSVEDTEKILNSMILGETLLNPTPFIQSTYNTISSQIAIALKCQNYNSTFVHRTFSFESALLDAMLHLWEGTATQVLVGGVDEMTINHLNITRKIGDWKMHPVGNMSLLSTGTPGALAGEGAGYFLLSNQKKDNTYATLRDVHTFFKPGGYPVIIKEIRDFITRSGVAMGDLDLILLGLNGDNRYDPVYFGVSEDLFPGLPLAYYKHLCGEYYTASAFALWLSSMIISRQSVPGIIRINDTEKRPVKNILVYSHYRNVNHSLFLVTV